MPPPDRAAQATENCCPQSPSAAIILFIAALTRPKPMQRDADIQAETDAQPPHLALYWPGYFTGLNGPAGAATEPPLDPEQSAKLAERLCQVFAVGDLGGITEVIGGLAAEATELAEGFDFDRLEELAGRLSAKP